MDHTPEEHALTPDDALDLALRLHQGGQYKEAEQLYRGLLQHNPNRLEALHLLGVLLYLQGKNEEGNDLMRRALEVAPDFAEAHLLLGNGLHRTGQTGNAAASWRKALDLQPHHAQANANLGRALLEQGELAEAESCLRLALTADPSKLKTRCDLGLLLKRQGKTEAAIAEFRQALAANPEYFAARSHLAHTLMDLDRLQEAEDCLREGLKLKEDHAPSHHNLALILMRKGDRSGAIEHYRQAVQYDPDLTEAHSNLANLLAEAGQLEDAARHFQRTVELDPDNTVAPYLLEIVSGRAPARAPIDYVKTLFDHYAPTFDGHLTEELEYASPQLLVDAVQGARPGARFENALDLGCGTGLTGERFRPLADHLTGVDLSPAMIEHAWEREVYDVIREADIEHYLERSDDTFDLILAADALVYFGDLAPVFSRLKERMAVGGLFCFTTEAGEEGEGWKAQHTGRFSHNVDYIGSLAQENGFIVIHTGIATLRQSPSGPVTGGVFILQKC
ncbi:MAG: tetratricopeptide repeat protein [Nitrospina sp.]|nr:tetratricopeptide repeat protein [Nitrospina sp.]